MSRASLVLAVAAFAAAALAAAWLVTAPVPPPSRADQAEAIAAELRCPSCQALSVADSPSGAAAEMRRQIDEMLAAGRSPDEIKRHFVDRYGEWILLAPTSPMVWLVPGALTLLGLLTLAAWLWQRGPPDRGGQPDAESSASGKAYRERIRDELEALDA